MTRTLAFFLKPGGVLIVADMAKTEKGDIILPDEVAHIVSHRAGFSKEDIEKVFVGAALQSFSFEPATSAKHRGKDVDFFIAKGVKSLV